MCMYVCLGHRYKQVRNAGTVQKRIANYDGKTDGLTGGQYGTVQYTVQYGTGQVCWGKGPMWKWVHYTMQIEMSS